MNLLCHREPVELNLQECDMFSGLWTCNNPCCRVLDELKSVCWGCIAGLHCKSQCVM